MEETEEFLEGSYLPELSESNIFIAWNEKRALSLWKSSYSSSTSMLLSSLGYSSPGR
jgi:hypothetical protein